MKKYLFAGMALAAGIAAMLHPPQPKEAIATASAPSARPLHRSLRRLLPAGAVVYVAGAVNAPGLYRLPLGSRAFAALKMAGGFGPNADTAGVNLAEIVSDGEEIAVPRVGEHRTRGSTARSGRLKKRAAKHAAAAPVDLNAADAAALTQLPGIGEELARRIVQFREINGRFASLDELADVAGMTPRRIERLSAYLLVK